MTEQAGSGERHLKDLQGADAADSFLPQISLLRESKREIEVILKVLDEGKLTLDLLEQNTVDIPISDLFHPREAGENSDQGETIRLAVYLQSIALTCRDTVNDKNFNKFLQRKGYTLGNMELLLTAFENLNDVWSTYKKVIDCLDIATWDRNPSPDRIWAALEAPRRRYIRALSAYYVQLSGVLNKLRSEPGVTS